jgi:hypothetical protein
MLLAKLIGSDLLLKGDCPSCTDVQSAQSTAFLALFLCQERNSTVANWQLSGKRSSLVRATLVSITF